MLKQISFWVFICLPLSSWAQTSSTYIAPIQTNSNYATGEDSHLVVRNTIAPNNRLFLYLGGTSSKPSSYEAISKFVGELGFDVINLAYPNSEATTNLKNETDSLAFDKYREEICYGTPISPAVQVDTLNSIHQRSIELLEFLDAAYPSQNWNQYLRSPQELNWSKIAVSGHSQGSGHACYFGKKNLVERVLMFAGPNDYSAHFQNSAKWLRTPGATPLDKQFGYLSLLDEAVDFNEQKINLEGLGIFPQYDSILVDHNSTPFQNSRFLYTTQRRGFALFYHNTPIKDSALNEEVWTYMLNADAATSQRTVQKIHPFDIYPNPLVGLGHTNIDILNAEILAYDVLGRSVLHIGKNPSSNSIYLEGLEPGWYSIVIKKADKLLSSRILIAP